MPRCSHTATCAFFTADVGYSPELNHAMKEQYCLEDNTRCARLLAAKIVGMENVPVEMLPTDEALLEELKKSRT